MFSEETLILQPDCLKVFISEFKGLRGAEEHLDIFYELVSFFSPQ